MGDVVLIVPVIQDLLKKYPNVHITVLTNPFFHPFYEGIPNLTLFPVDLKGKHKGILGLKKLANELTSLQKFDVVIDLHAVIRTWVIGSFFRIQGVTIYRIDKGRKEKKAFIRRKIRKTLPHTTQRYHEVFQKAGFDFNLEKSLLNTKEQSDFAVNKHIKPTAISIGIAPFAAHKSKQWGLDKTEAFIEEINRHYKVQFYLFGGGKEEVNQLNTVADKYPNTTNFAGSFKLTEELHLLENLDVIVSMDSGNMHIASLLEIPVISIWGGTHPDVGFSALHQPEENSIQIAMDELPCRPCSVFGTNDCNLKTTPFACMTQITPSLVIARLQELKILV